MSTRVVMEALSPTMEEGRVVEWKKQEGEAVAVGDVLADVETDKAVMELVARASGTLLKHIVKAGATVPVSEPVAIIGEPGEAVDGGEPEAKAVKPARTHWDMLLERRSIEELEEVLAERLAALHEQQLLRWSNPTAARPRPAERN